MAKYILEGAGNINWMAIFALLFSSSYLKLDKITQENLENKEIVALIAYLQRLGTDIKIKEPSK